MPYAPGTTTGFTSISDYLSANQGTLDNERAALSGDVGGQLDAAKAADDAVISAGQGPDAPPPPPPEKNPFEAASPNPLMDRVWDKSRVAWDAEHLGKNPYAGQAPNPLIEES